MMPMELFGFVTKIELARVPVDGKNEIYADYAMDVVHTYTRQRPGARIPDCISFSEYVDGYKAAERAGMPLVTLERIVCSFKTIEENVDGDRVFVADMFKSDTHAGDISFTVWFASEAEAKAFRAPAWFGFDVSDGWDRTTPDDASEWEDNVYVHVGKTAVQVAQKEQAMRQKASA